MGNDHLGVVGRNDVHGPSADGNYLSVSTVDLDPVSRLVGILYDSDDSRDQAAGIVLECEGESQPHGRDQRDDILESGLDQQRNDDRDTADPDQQPDQWRHPPDQQASMYG